MRESRAPRLRFRSFPVAACALASLSGLGVAHAEPYDAKAKRAANSAINEDYIGGKFPAAQKKLEKAIAACKKPGQCSPRVLARLYRDLGVVFLGGLNRGKQGRQALALALQTDPTVKLDPDLTTPEIAQAFKEVGGSMSAKEKSKAKAREEAADENADDSDSEKVVLEETPAPTDSAAPAEETDSGKARKNWFSLGVQQDLLLHSAADPACYGPDYTCFGPGGGEYGGPIFDGQGNKSAGGLAIATTRVLLGFERVFGKNLLLGGRLGLAFGGSPTSKSGVKFMPIHVELRGSYVLGDDPFAGPGFRPYGGLGVGLAEVDSHLAVDYFESQEGYNMGYKGTLDAWRRTGKLFVAPTLGAQYAFGSASAISAELRLLVMLGTSGLAPAAGIGYAHGL